LELFSYLRRMNTENEIEIKKRILNLGAHESIDRKLTMSTDLSVESEKYETNIMYKGNGLKKGHVLRLRIMERKGIDVAWMGGIDTSEGVLTFKGPVSGVAGVSGAKDRLENETSVDVAPTLKILRGLGYSPSLVYQKFRKTFCVNPGTFSDKAEICLDTLPFGSFVEIEAANGHVIGEVIDRYELGALATEEKSYPALAVEAMKSTKRGFRFEITLHDGIVMCLFELSTNHRIDTQFFPDRESLLEVLL